MATFLRFHCPGRRAGIFQAAFDLIERGALPARERARLERQLSWFDEHLRTPRQFLRSMSKSRPSAICWFKDDARRCLRRAWIIATLLKRNGVIVEFERTRQPGFVTYEDRHQVAAIRFADR